MYHTPTSSDLTCFWSHWHWRRQGQQKYDLQSSEDGKNLASNIFCLFCTFHLYAELPLTWKVVLCVDQKGKFLPSYGFCDTQLWILQLLSVLKFARVSHFHQDDLYLHLVVTILASFLLFLEVGVTGWIFIDENWQHIVNLDKVHITLDCVCLGKKQEHPCRVWEHMQLRGSTVLGRWCCHTNTSINEAISQFMKNVHPILPNL